MKIYYVYSILTETCICSSDANKKLFAVIRIA